MIDKYGNHIKCLSNDLICKIIFDDTLTDNTYGTYSVYNYLHDTNSYEEDPFFVGHVFVSAGSRSILIDMNDIIESQKCSFDFLKKDAYEGDVKEGTKLLNYLYSKFKVVLELDNTPDDVESTYNSIITAGLWTEYPTIELDGGNVMPTLPNTDEDKFGFLNGFKEGVYDLVPHYPFVKTEHYGYGFVGYYPTDFIGEEDEHGTFDYLEFSGLEGDDYKMYYSGVGSNANYIKLDSLLDEVSPLPETQFHMQIKPFTKTDANLIVSKALGYNTFHLSRYGNATREIDGVTYEVWYFVDNHRLYLVNGKNVGDTIYVLESDISSEIDDTIVVAGLYDIYSHDDWVGQKQIAEDLGVIDDWRDIVSLSTINERLEDVKKTDEEAQEIVAEYGAEKIEAIEEEAENGEPSIYAEIGGYFTKVAEFDECAADYYVQWIDRTGGIQSQAFKNLATMSENFTDSTITDMRGYKRSNRKESALKWVLNTDWISEKLFPYYESLFTSPYILLYDVKNDKSWNVILKDTQYTEKTMKNQAGKLFNLTINVEQNKTNSIVY